MRAGGSEPGMVEVCSEGGGMKASRSDKMCVNERETSGKANTHKRGEEESAARVE